MQKLTTQVEALRSTIDTLKQAKEPCHCSTQMGAGSHVVYRPKPLRRGGSFGCQRCIEEVNSSCSHRFICGEGHRAIGCGKRTRSIRNTYLPAELRPSTGGRSSENRACEANANSAVCFSGSGKTQDRTG